ncbi:MAG: ribonuclease E inhibitor RraB [Steroidobacteraceae bacterium]
MSWLYAFLVIGAALAIGRIVFQVRKLRAQPVDDWDSKLIERLRRSGADPFRPHDVDFFLALPSELAATAVMRRLEAEGFSVDVRHAPEHADHPYSVHAQKAMQLSIEVAREFARLRTR